MWGGGREGEGERDGKEEQRGSLTSPTFETCRDANLTHQYYALFSKEYVSWMVQEESWRDLFSGDCDPQLLEKGSHSNIFLFNMLKHIENHVVTFEKLISSLKTFCLFGE